MTCLFLWCLLALLNGYQFVNQHLWVTHHAFSHIYAPCTHLWLLLVFFFLLLSSLLSAEFTGPQTVSPKRVQGGCTLLHPSATWSFMLSCVWLFVTPWTVVQQAPLSMDYPGKNIGMDCHFLLQGIFQNWSSNLHLLWLLNWQADSLPLKAWSESA